MSEHRSTFPRGLVLGLTMAETAILIIFVLLLALTVLLARETDRRQAAEQDLERFEEIRQTLAQRGLSAEELLRSIRARGDDQRAADSWRELVRNLEGRMPDVSPETIVSHLNEAQEINELLDEAGLEPTPDDVSTLVAILRAGREADVTADDVWDAISVQEALVDALGDGGREMDRQDIVDLVRDAERWRARVGTVPDLASELDRANARIAQLEVQAGGRGTDHPSCWYDADNSVAYLFDVALTDDGFVLREASAPQHRRRRASLPLDDVVTGRTLNTEQFLAQTRPVFRWSVGEGCRFFVRAFDLTAADQKELYKTRMRTLESHFYKNARPSGPPPFSDPPPPLP